MIVPINPSAVSISHLGSRSSRISTKLLEMPFAEFTSRIQKGGALLRDMRQLVCHWEKLPQGSNPQRFVKDLLPKATLARAHDTYARAFLPRFIQGSPKEAWRLCASMERALPAVEIVKPVYYWITARAEPLLYLYATDELYQQSRIGAASVGSAELAVWIKKTCEGAGKAWSGIVTIKVARGILATLRDFGVLTGSSRKTIAVADLPLASFCLIAFCLRIVLANSQTLIEHPDWRLFLLSPGLVERLLLEAHQHGWLNYQTAGRVSRLEFPDTSFDNYVRRVLSR
jgi:hypothetical protein